MIGRQELTRRFTLFLVLMASCVFLYACGGGDEEDNPNDLVPTPTDEPNDSSPTDGGVVPPKDLGAAPQFQLSDLNGNQVSLADFEGQVVVLNFWATWCGPCRREVPDMVEVQTKHQDEGFTILGISRDLEVKDGKLIKDELAVRDFMKKTNMNYPVLWDTENVWGALYNGFGLPTTVILDREHRMRFRHNNIVDKATLDAEVSTLLNESMKM